MTEQLLGVYGVAYPRDPQGQQQAIERYVEVASESHDELKPLMYEILRRFSQLTKVHHLEEQVCKLAGHHYATDCKGKCKCEGTGKCASCEQTAHLVCSGCRLGRDPVMYCSRACQTLHWRQCHKQECKTKTLPWDAKEITLLVERLIHENDDSVHASRDVANVCARLFNCVCVYISKTEGDLMLVIVFSSPICALPMDHTQFAYDIAQVYKPQISMNRCIILSCHINLFLENYRMWKRISP